MTKNRFILSMVALGLFSSASLAHCDSGSFEYTYSGTYSYKKVNIGGTTYTGGHQVGTIQIITSTNGPFTAGMGGASQCLVFAAKSDAGTDLTAPCDVMFTGTASGLTLMASRKVGGIDTAGAGGAGKQELLGTGDFEGITGNCEYTSKFHKMNQVTVIGKCAWNR